MKLKMGLIPKLHLLKRHHSTKSDVLDIRQTDCAYRDVHHVLLNINL